MPVLDEASNNLPLRASLLRQHAELLQSLVNGQPATPLFDASRVRSAADGLAKKRCRQAANAWPVLARWLGADFDRRFAAYAQATPLPSAGGPVSDGWLFLRYLAQSERLPDAVRRAQCMVHLRYVWRRGGLRPRRWPALRIMILRQSPRLLVAWHWPHLRLGRA